MTTVLDPGKAPAKELAALYHDRWEVETALDELKTHLRGSRIVLRSKTPDLVRQEFYGLMMAHFAVRGLMHEAAIEREAAHFRRHPPLGGKRRFIRACWKRLSKSGSHPAAEDATRVESSRR